MPCGRKWQPTPVFLPGKPLGQRSLAGYSPRGRKEPDTTEHTNTHLPLHPRVRGSEKRQGGPAVRVAVWGAWGLP